MDFSTPIAMPRGTHYGSEYYCVYSIRAGRVVHLFSKLEYFNFLTMDTDPSVEKLCEQPLKIEYLNDAGKTRHTVFDLWVKYKDGREELQEVKYSKELTDDSKGALRSQNQILVQRRWCEDNGVAYTVRTEKDIIKGQFLIQNLSVIAGLARRYTPQNESTFNSLIARYLDDADYDGRKSVTVRELIEKELLPIPYQWAHLAYMYVNGLVTMNLHTKSLDLNTEVKLLCRK